MRRTIRINNDKFTKEKNEYINRLITECTPGDILSFEPGQYLIHEPICISDKHDLILDGNGAVFLTDIKGYLEEEDPGCDAFHIEKCSNVTVRNFTVRTEWRNNIGGTIVNNTPEYLDIRIDQPEEPGWSGKEYVTQLYCISEERALLSENIGAVYRKHWCTFGDEIPNSHTSITNIPHDILDNGIWRFYGVEHTPYGSGTRCWLCHYDKCTAFLFRDCEKITIENVQIPDWNGMAFIMLPACRDFVFRHVIARPDCPEYYPGAIAADVFHSTGLGGSLLIENCILEGVGDDVANIHTPVLTVRSIEGKYAVLFFDKEYPLFPKRWAKAGDQLTVFDADDLSVKAHVKVLWVKEDQIMVDRPELLKKGDLVINEKYRPDITVRDSEFYHSRSRLCIQAATNVDISGCIFKMDSHKAQIYISSAYHYWGEAGGVGPVHIHDNILYANMGPAIWARLNEEDILHKAKVHQSIRIDHNKFINGHGMIYDSMYHSTCATVDLSSVADVVISDNVFDTGIDEAVHIVHCDHIKVENNEVRQ